MEEQARPQYWTITRPLSDNPVGLEIASCRSIEAVTAIVVSLMGADVQGPTTLVIDKRAHIGD